LVPLQPIVIRTQEEEEEEAITQIKLPTESIKPKNQTKKKTNKKN